MTLYFKQEHFKTSVPVAITSMLVMYTLNQSISAKLPQTSYVKFIDVWLLFGLIQPFFIIVMLVIIEHDHNHQKVVEFSGEKKKPCFLKSFARVILPSIALLFIVMYILVALIFYYG